MLRSWRHALVFGGMLLLLVPGLAACGSTSTSTSTTKTIRVGLVTDTGGLNDRGFNHLAYVGLQNAEKQLGIKGSVVESHSSSDYVPNLTNYASQGYDLVIAVGFLMQAAVGQVSAEYPKVHFALIDGTPTDASGNNVTRNNVASLLFREQQAGALVGVIAGLLEKSGQTKLKQNTISAVGGVSIPPVNHYIAGYKWAAEREDPGIKVLVGYSNDFSDQTKCAGVAQSQITSGADVVFQVAGGCGLGALTQAGKDSVYSIGVDTDQKADDPSVIASAVKRVDIATFLAIQQVAQGKFQAGANYFDLQNGGVGYAPGNLNLPSNIASAVQTMETQIKNGTVTVPATIPAS